MSHTRFKADAVTNRDITSYGNIRGKYVFGNAAFMTGVNIASIPSVISADVNGNIVSTGNITTYATVNAGYYRGDGGGLFGIPQTGIQPGTFYRDISGNLIGNTVQANYLFGNGYFLTGISSSINTNGNLIIGGYIAASDIYANTITNSNNIRSNSLTIVGNATVGGFIAAVDMYSNTSVISGGITANTISVRGNALVSGFIAATDVFSNNATMTGDLSANGIVITGNSTVIGNSTVRGFLAAIDVFSNNTVLTGNLSANGIVITGNSTVVGNSVVRGFIAATDVFSNNTALTGNLSANGIVITGNSTIIGNSVVRGFIAATDIFSNNTTLTGNLSANGIVIAGNTSVSGFISASEVYGINAIMTNNVSANNVTLVGRATADTIFGRTDVIAGANLLATQIFANNITASTNLRANALNISGNAVMSGNIVAEGIFANTLTSYKDVVANSLFINGNINTTGYISGGNIFGNSGYFKGELVANNLYIGGNIIGVGYLSIGNVYGNAAEFKNAIVFGNLSCANLSVTTVSAGDVTATRFIGNGALLTGILTTATNEITADLFGNVTSSGAITTSGNFYAGSISGDGSNITNIALSSLQPGDIYRDIYGNITGTNTTMTGSVSCATVLASNIQAGNVQGIFNVAYSNLTTSPFNFQAQTAANLFIRSGTSTMALIRTDGIALTSNGPAYRFGTTDFDKGLLTNGSDGQFASGTLTGDMILHNTKTGLRTCIASSYGRPEITLLNGNIGIRTTNPGVDLDINGDGNIGNIAAVRGNIGNIRMMGGNVAASGQINVIGNVVANSFIGPAFAVNGLGDISGNSLTVINVSASGNITSGGAVVGSYFSGSGTGLQNIPSSALVAGDLFKNISGDLTGNYCNVAIVNATVANISTRGEIGNVILSGGNIIANGQVDITGNVVANCFVGNGVRVIGQAAVTDLVVSGGTFLKGAVGINVAAPGVQFAVSGTTQITGSTSVFGNLRCTGDTNLGNAFATRLCLRNITGGGIAENIFYIEANVPGSTSFNLISATVNNIDPPNVQPIFVVNGLGGITGKSVSVSDVYSADIATANVISAKSTTSELVVNGNTNVTGFVASTDLYTGTVYSSIYTGSSTNKYNATLDHEFYTSGGVQVANITSTGNLIISGQDAIKATGSTWSNPSDRRLKDNIISANLDECFNTVKSLDLKSFSWKDTRQDGPVLGWIAQEVELVLPKSITTREMFGLTDCKVLNADQLYVNMYGALKKSIQMIDTLKTEVDFLKGEIDILKTT